MVAIVDMSFILIPCLSSRYPSDLAERICGGGILGEQMWAHVIHVGVSVNIRSYDLYRIKMGPWAGVCFPGLMQYSSEESGVYLSFN